MFARLNPEIVNALSQYDVSKSFFSNRTLPKLLIAFVKKINPSESDCYNLVRGIQKALDSDEIKNGNGTSCYAFLVKQMANLVGFDAINFVRTCEKTGTPLHNGLYAHIIKAEQEHKNYLPNIDAAFEAIATYKINVEEKIAGAVRELKNDQDKINTAIKNASDQLRKAEEQMKLAEYERNRKTRALPCPVDPMQSFVPDEEILSKELQTITDEDEINRLTKLFDHWAKKTQYTEEYTVTLVDYDTDHRGREFEFNERQVIRTRPIPEETRRYASEQCDIYRSLIRTEKEKRAAKSPREIELVNALKRLKDERLVRYQEKKITYDQECTMYNQNRDAVNTAFQKVQLELEPIIKQCKTNLETFYLESSLLEKKRKNFQMENSRNLQYVRDTETQLNHFKDANPRSEAFVQKKIDLNVLCEKIELKTGIAILQTKQKVDGSIATGVPVGNTSSACIYPSLTADMKSPQSQSEQSLLSPFSSTRPGFPPAFNPDFTTLELGDIAAASTTRHLQQGERIFSDYFVSQQDATPSAPPLAALELQTSKNKRFDNSSSTAVNTNTTTRPLLKNSDQENEDAKRLAEIKTLPEPPITISKKNIFSSPSTVTNKREEEKTNKSKTDAVQEPPIITL